jgi:ethanolamine utilization protein EutN
MLLGTVVGHVWATRKEATLQGLRFLVVQPYLRGGGASAETIIAVDPIGADVGERVLVVFGRAARHAIGKGHDVGFQCAVVGIVDGVALADGSHVGQTAAGDRGPGEGRREAARARPARAQETNETNERRSSDGDAE